MFTGLVILALFGAYVEGLPATNSTIVHDPRERCKPTTWYDITLFFLGNYIAHAATVKSYPGEATSRVLIATLGALLIPSSGLIRGLNSILRNAKFKRKGILTALISDPDYETAAASGSLIMVVRTKSWKPYPGDRVLDVILREESREVPAEGWALKKRNWDKKTKARVFYKLEPVPKNDDKPLSDPSRTLKVFRGPWTEERAKWWMYTDTADEYVSATKTIHGFYDFKDQQWSYALAHVPRDAVIAVREGEDNQDPSPRRLESASAGLSLLTQTTAGDRRSTVSSLAGLIESTPRPVIAASYSLPKAMIAIVQLSSAAVTLYQSFGRQLDYYGYAAFGLTVFPYALMSFVNLLSNMLTPDYYALYLIGSDVMDEAIRRGARFDGVVGRLVQDTGASTATAEVVSTATGNAKGESVTFSYHDETEHKTFPATVIDYSTPSLPMKKRRKLVTDLIETTYRDLSPSIFIPSCSKFLRHRQYTYPKRANCTQMTIEGSFTFSWMGYSAWRNLICLIDAIVVLAIIGVLTKFRVGNSTNPQRCWILNWYISGALYSGFGIEDAINFQRRPEPDMGPPNNWWGLLIALLLLYSGVATFGGFVVVVKMLYQYGTCSFN